MKILNLSGVVVMVALATLAGTALTSTAMAEDAAGPDCAKSATSNLELINELKAAKDSDARRAILAPVLKQTPAEALCIMRMVRTSLPTLSKVILEDVIAILSLDPANDPLIKKLTEEFGDLLADAGNIEPAAGDENPNDPNDNNFGPGDNGPGENPNQLGDPDGPGGGAPGSPSEPSL